MAGAPHASLRRANVAVQGESARSVVALHRPALLRPGLFALDLGALLSTAARISFLNFSIPSSNAAAIGKIRVLGTLRLNFFKFSTAAGSSILLATTSRRLSSNFGL